MKVNVALEFDESQLRRVRAAFGRGGVATRKDCRTFVADAVFAALGRAPQPKPPRGSKPPVAERVPLEPAPRKSIDSGDVNRLLRALVPPEKVEAIGKPSGDPESDAAKRQRDRIATIYGHARQR